MRKISHEKHQKQINAIKGAQATLPLHLEFLLSIVRILYATDLKY